jgi:hypothetical protein
MNTYRIAAALFLSLTGSVHASLVEIHWDPNNAFRYSAELEAGGFAEVCGELAADERVSWAFEADAELDFNIHYHEGDEVTYPVKSPQVRSLADELTAPVEQTYCWMWTNRLDDPATLTVELSREP